MLSQRTGRGSERLEMFGAYFQYDYKAALFKIKNKVLAFDIFSIKTDPIMQQLALCVKYATHPCFAAAWRIPVPNG